MKEGAYSILMLSSTNMSSCTTIWTDQMNCSGFSLLPLKLSSSAALAPLDKWLPVGMSGRIAFTMDGMALVAHPCVALGFQGTVFKGFVGCLELYKLLGLVVEEFT